MHLGHNKYKGNYTLHNKNLTEATEEKDIGVTIDTDLSFDKHIQLKVNKATQMFTLIRRTFKHLDAKSMTAIYKTMVRAHLEYANTVWSPYLIKHIEAIEQVQRMVRRQMPGMENLFIRREAGSTETTIFSVQTIEWRNDWGIQDDPPTLNTFKNRLDRHWNHLQYLTRIDYLTITGTGRN